MLVTRAQVHRGSVKGVILKFWLVTPLLLVVVKDIVEVAHNDKRFIDPLPIPDTDTPILLAKTGQITLINSHGLYSGLMCPFNRFQWLNNLGVLIKSVANHI